MRPNVYLKDLVRRLRESTDDADLNTGEAKNKGNDFELPTTHKPGMKVPKGGSSCSNCRHFDGNDSCQEKHFVAWQYGNARIPGSPDEYCSDWWEPSDSGVTGEDGQDDDGQALDAVHLKKPGVNAG